MISIAPISSLIGQPALASPSIVTVQLKRTLAWCGRPAVQPGTQRGQAGVLNRAGSGGGSYQSRGGSLVAHDGLEIALLSDPLPGSEDR